MWVSTQLKWRREKTTGPQLFVRRPHNDRHNNSKTQNQTNEHDNVVTLAFVG